MTKSITAAVLKAACPQARVDLVETAKYINIYFPKFGITTNRRVRYVLAQCFQETDGLKTYKEYASGAAYEGRKDLGNTLKGDGAKYAGRGMIMLTGRYNYLEFAQWLVAGGYIPHVDKIMVAPQRLREPELAVLAACHYLVNHKRNGKNCLQIADTGDFEELTRAINGGLNGYKDRLTYLGRLNTLFGNEEIKFSTEPSLEIIPPLPQVKYSEKPPTVSKPVPAVPVLPAPLAPGTLFPPSVKYKEVHPMDNLPLAVAILTAAVLALYILLLP